MSKKLNCWEKIEIIQYLKVVSFGFLFSVILANCNNGGKSDRETKKDSAYPSTDSAGQTNTRPDSLNWLDVHPDWDTVAFDSDPDDSRGIELEKKKIRAYVRGWADESNLEHHTHYVVEEFDFTQKSRSPLRYTVKAYLNPPVRHVHEIGGHLIPSEPPPPK